MFPHPWLRLNIAIRTMLSTRWGDQWLTVKAELGKALALQRRHFLQGVSASILAAPLVAEAQQTAKVARIGFLSVNANHKSHGCL
jgi:hypothetical protein